MSKYPIKECPKCGCKVVYTKEKAYGTVIWRISLDETEEAENGDMYGNLNYTYTSKYVYCSECDKRLFEISEME